MVHVQPEVPKNFRPIQQAGYSNACSTTSPIRHECKCIFHISLGRHFVTVDACVQASQGTLLLLLLPLAVSLFFRFKSFLFTQTRTFDLYITFFF